MAQQGTLFITRQVLENRNVVTSYPFGPTIQTRSGGGRVELETTPAAHALRPGAWGRKNGLPLGGEKAGPKIAASLSVRATCERLGLEAREVLMAGLPKWGRTSITEVKHLTPPARQRVRQPPAAATAGIPKPGNVGRIRRKVAYEKCLHGFGCG